jgi:DNA-binding response OmpR family regulator
LTRGISHRLFTTFLPFDYQFATPKARTVCDARVVASPLDSEDTLYVGELEIRLGDSLVLANGRALMLSVREYELLVAMARKTGAIVTRDELFATVWGGQLRAGDRSVDVYVSKLRGKLEVAMPDRRFIHTHPGFGYRFQPEAQPELSTRESSAGRRFTADRVSEQERLSRDVHIGATGT